MAYSEIINEIQEQIDSITANIVQYQADIEQMELDIIEKQDFIQQFQDRISGLTQLRVNAQSLSDAASDQNINLNINVQGANTYNVDHNLA